MVFFAGTINGDFQRHVGPSFDRCRPEAAHRLRDSENQRNPRAQMSDAILPCDGALPARVMTPTLLQMEGVECGAAALGIIMRYYDLWRPLEQLRMECGVTRDGSKASNLLKAARRFGLEASGVRCELNALLKTEPPVILYWNFNHFLVYEGVSQGKVHLNDPATGPRRINISELEASFTGVVLKINRGPAFVPGGEKPSLMAALRRRISGFEIGLSFALLTGLLLIVPNIVNPAFTRVFIDQYLIGDKTNILRPFLSCMPLSIGFITFFSCFQPHFLFLFETKLALTTSAKFFTHVVKLPMEFYSQRYAGEIGSRVLINDKVAKVLSDKLVTTGLILMAFSFLSFR